MGALDGKASQKDLFMCGCDAGFGVLFGKGRGFSLRESVFLFLFYPLGQPNDENDKKARLD